jgi:hypothetical protein
LAARYARIVEPLLIWSHGSESCEEARRVADRHFAAVRGLIEFGEQSAVGARAGTAPDNFDINEEFMCPSLYN